MKTALPILAAGGAFAAAAILGLLGGIYAAGRWGQPLAVPAGLVLGGALGGYSAIRLIVNATQ